VEAVAHLTKGLTLLDALPDSPEHIQHELTLRIALGNALIATKGYAARDMEHAYARALELCRQLGDTAQLFPVLYGVWVCHLLRAEYTTARELGEEFLHLAQRQQDPGLLLEAHRMLAITLYCLGECGPAHTHAERGVALYDPKVHHSHALIYGQDPGVSCQMYAAWTLWFLGYPDQALQRSHEALRLARELSHPLSLAMALSFATRLHQLRREGPAAQAQAEVLMALSGEQGFPQYLSHGMVLRGWALAAQGHGEEGMVQMRQGLAAYRATGAEVFRAYYHALLAEACGGAGQPQEGLHLLAEALTAAHNTGARFDEAELHRLKGELLLQSCVQGPEFAVSILHAARRTPHAEAAETCFRQALEIAWGQQAKSLELRAALSLSRLWQRQGQRTEARQLLAPIYG